MRSAFPNVVKTKHYIENDIKVAMSFISKFGDVDQETTQATGKNVLWTFNVLL